jgi:hypothetical protein
MIAYLQSKWVNAKQPDLEELEKALSEGNLVTVPAGWTLHFFDDSLFLEPEKKTSNASVSALFFASMIISLLGLAASVTAIILILWGVK